MADHIEVEPPNTEPAAGVVRSPEVQIPHDVVDREAISKKIDDSKASAVFNHEAAMAAGTHLAVNPAESTQGAGSEKNFFTTLFENAAKVWGKITTFVLTMWRRFFKRTEASQPTPAVES